ncbi:MAG: ketoacyl-ACP synthase III [Defluviitaleaceae bacterium]|nr:ketoacyl-ACP synthase III [Defluviitaleaceae bacterium]
MNGVKIRAAAHYVPSAVLGNDQISTWVDTTDEWIVKRTGVSQRRISEGENTSDLSIEVGKQLLGSAGLAAEDVDLIMVATITPDYLTPSVACLVQEGLGAVNAFAFDISAACSGFVFGLSTAQKYLASGQYKNILIIGADVLSKITDWDDRGSCILFGDGAGGVLLVADPDALYSEKLHSRGGTVINGGHMEVVNPFSKRERKFDFLKLDGREVFDFAVKSVTENITELLEKVGMTLDDIDHIIPHQANGRIIEAIAKKLKTGLEKFYVNIQKYGNTSAASIPIALSEMFTNGTLKQGTGKKVILVGFGGGLTWGSVLMSV